MNQQKFDRHRILTSQNHTYFCEHQKTPSFRLRGLRKVSLILPKRSHLFQRNQSGASFNCAYRTGFFCQIFTASCFINYFLLFSFALSSWHTQIINQVQSLTNDIYLHSRMFLNRQTKIKILSKSFHHKGSIVECGNLRCFDCKCLLVKNYCWNCFILTTILFYIIFRVFLFLVLLCRFQYLLQRRYFRPCITNLCWGLSIFLLWAFRRSIFSINAIHSLCFQMVCAVPHIAQSDIIIMKVRLSDEQKGQNVKGGLQPISERSHHSFLCECPMCRTYEDKQQMNLLTTQQNLFRAIKSQRKDSNFVTSYLEVILKHLIPPSNKIVRRGIEIFIPQICFFEEGEPSYFYFNRDLEDYHLIRHKKEKINQTNMIRMFNQRRKKYRERIKKALHLISTEDKRQSSKKSWKQKKNQPKNKSQNLNNLIIRFTDGCQTLLSELGFFHIMQKRKQDLFWKKVYSIRNQVVPYFQMNNDKYMFSINFDQNIKYKQLYNRSKQLMNTYSQRYLPTHPQFIADEKQDQFCSNLLEKSRQQLAYYLTYKIVSFISTFADEQIVKGTFKLLINEQGKIYLLDVFHLQINSLLKYDWTMQKFSQMTTKRQYDRYHRKELKISQQIIQKSKIIEQLMSNQYEEMKVVYGVTVEPQADENQKLNNDFFHSFHPQIEQDLSQLVKIDMPFVQFKQKYLGEKPQRKHLYKPFNSKIIRQLHKLTPLTRRSLGNTPDRQGASQWRKRSLSNAWKTMSN